MGIFFSSLPLDMDTTELKEKQKQKNKNKIQGAKAGQGRRLSAEEVCIYRQPHSASKNHL